MKTGRYCIPLWAVLVSLGACSSPEPAAPESGISPSLTLEPSAASGGQVVDGTYRFAVAADAAPLPPGQLVFVHMHDADGRLLWSGDHAPPVPTEEWTPGRTIEYSRPVAVPRGLLGGEVHLDLGLYGASGQRLAMTGHDTGGLSYRVAALGILPPGGEPAAVFRDGWHPLEIPDEMGVGEWRWSSGRATMQMPNPRRDTELVLELDQPIASLTHGQQVEIHAAGAVIDRFTLAGGARTVRRVRVSRAQLGEQQTVSFDLTVDDTFVPARDLEGSSDQRELGVRLFHAYLAGGRGGR